MGTVASALLAHLWGICISGQVTEALLRGQRPASEAAPSREQEAARDDALPVVLLPLSPAWSLDCTAAAAPRAKGVCGSVCVRVGLSGVRVSWRAELDPSEHTGLLSSASHSPQHEKNSYFSGSFSSASWFTPILTPAHAKRCMTLARAVLPSLVEQNQFHLLSWEALSCCWLLHQTMAVPLTPSQLLFSSGAGTLHVCCFVPAWWMLSDDCIPIKKNWD